MCDLGLPFDEFTYFLKAQGQNICISELSLAFDGLGSTYFLKTQGQDTYLD